MARKAKINRKTKETSISVSVNLDGKGKYKIKTGIGFLDHMLEQLSKHSFIELYSIVSVLISQSVELHFHPALAKILMLLKQTISKNNTLEKYPTITARAFSSTQNILNLTEKNLKKNGKYLLLKGRIEKIEEEMAAINTNNYKYEIIELDNKKYERHIVQIKKNE